MESTVPGVETQLYHLPWTDPDCTEQGEDPEYLHYIDDNIVGDDTGAEVFEKTKRIIRILLKISFALKQNTIKYKTQYKPVQEIPFIILLEYFSKSYAGEMGSLLLRALKVIVKSYLSLNCVFSFSFPS